MAILIFPVTRKASAELGNSHATTTWIYSDGNSSCGRASASSASGGLFSVVLRFFDEKI